MARQVLREKFVPRAQEIGRQAGPKLAEARRRVKNAARDLEKKLSERK